MCDPGSDPTLERKFRGHKDSVSALCFSPNDDQLVSSSLDSSIMLWKLGGTMRSYRFEGHKEAVLEVTFSPSGKLLASVSRDRSVRLWLPTVTGSTGEFRAHSQTVRSVQFTSDNLKLLTASDDKTIKLWSVARQKFISSFLGHTNWVRCARLSNDNSVIASCSDDKTLKLWNVDTGECIHTFAEQKGSGQQVAWHPSGCYVAVGLSNGTVKLYDTRTHSLLQHYRIHEGAVTQISFHPSGSYLLTCSKDNKMKILDLLEGHPVFTLSGHTGAVTAVTFSHNGEYFASGGEDKQVLIWKSNLAELREDYSKENSNGNIVSATSSKTVVGSKCNSDNQEGNVWNWCYHSKRVPIGVFYQADSVQDNFEECVSSTPSKDRFSGNEQCHSKRRTKTSSVGDTSHIPRQPPTPQAYTLPTIGQACDEDTLMGMISLKNDEVCYTNGTIEWVGKRRLLSQDNENACSPNYSPEPHAKKRKSCQNRIISKTYTDKCVGTYGCECTDIIPTINTIVDHLNALHDTIEIVDERLNLVENVLQN